MTRRRVATIERPGAVVPSGVTQVEADTRYADKGRVDPGTEGSTGQVSVVDSAGQAAWGQVQANAWAWGIRPGESAANLVTRLEDFVADAATAGRPIVLYVPEGEYNFGGATVNIGRNVSITGTRPRAANTGTTIHNLSLTIGASGEWIDWVHITNLMMRTPPAHGVEFLGLGAEGTYVNDVVVTDAAGDGVRYSEGGTPTRIGHLSLHRNTGAGVRVIGGRNVTKMDFISGDMNGDGLIVFQDSDPDGGCVVLISAIKSESQQPVVDLVNVHRDSSIEIGVLSVYDPGGYGDGTTPMIRQSGGTAHVTVGSAVTTNAAGYGAGYSNTGSGITIPVADMQAHRVTTRPFLHASSLQGLAQTAQTVATGDVGTSETTLLHGLGYTPSVVSITTDADARVWLSSPPDDDFLYLTASSACTVTVVLDRATPQALGTLALFDDFTASDGSIAGRTPTTGSGTWSVWNAAAIASNRLSFSNGGHAAYFNAGSPDVRIDATLNFGDHTGTRSFGFITRWVDASNHWRIVLSHNIFGNGSVVVEKVVSGTVTTVDNAGGYTGIPMNTDFDARLKVVGSVATVTVNGAVAHSLTITSEHATATRHGILSRLYGTNVAAPTADDVSMYAL